MLPVLATKPKGKANGRTKGYADRGEPADLTAAQLKELINAAPEAKPEPKAESKK